MVLSTLEIAIIVVYLFVCVALIIMILMQSKDAGLSQTVTGKSSSTFYGSNKAMTKDVILSKMTTLFMIIFFILTLLLFWLLNK